MRSDTVDGTSGPGSRRPADAPLGASFATVDECLATIECESLQDLSIDELRRRYLWFSTLTRAAQAIGARHLAEIDRRDQVADDPDLGSSAPTWWLQETLNVTNGSAYALLRTARQLDQLPETGGAFRRGLLGAEHVTVICRAMEEVGRTTLDASSTERVLVEAGQRMSPLELRRHWAQMRYRADQAAGVAAEEEQRERRWVRYWQTRWDTFRIEGELDAESGAVVKTALRAILGRRAPGDERTPGQRRADALTDLARRALASGELPAQGGEKPQLMVVAELSTLRLAPGSPLARLDWGPCVTGHTARRLAEDADVTPVVVDARGDILHVGRRARMLTRRQRKALNLRDGRCQAPGCDRTPEQCTPHHLVHWIDGGPSDLVNTRLYCDVHHAKLHPENDRFRGPP